LAHPGDALVVILRRRLPGFVFPVCSDAFFRYAMHFLGADLHLERLAAVDHSGMERLIEIGPGDRDVVLETAGDGAPDVVDHAESGITVALGIGDDAHGEQIVDLSDPDFLADEFTVDGVQAFYPRFEFSGNAGFDQLGLDGSLDFLEELFVLGALSLISFCKAKKASGSR